MKIIVLGAAAKPRFDIFAQGIACPNAKGFLANIAD